MAKKPPKLRVLKPSIRTIGPTVKPMPGPADGYHHWYGHRAWRRRRDEHLQAEPLCRACWALDGLYIAADVADHNPPHGGDRYQFFHGPLVSLCKKHHDGWKAAKEAAGDFTMPPAVTPPRRPLLV